MVTNQISHSFFLHGGAHGRGAERGRPTKTGRGGYGDSAQNTPTTPNTATRSFYPTKSINPFSLKNEKKKNQNPSPFQIRNFESNTRTLLSPLPSRSRHASPRRRRATGSRRRGRGGEGRMQQKPAAEAMEEELKGEAVGPRRPGLGLWLAARRRLAPDDPFFAAGDMERELLAKQVRSLPLSPPFLLLA